MGNFCCSVFQFRLLPVPYFLSLNPSTVFCILVLYLSVLKFPCFYWVCNPSVKHFCQGCFTLCQIILTFLSSSCSHVLSFFIQFRIFMVIDMMTNFQLKPGRVRYWDWFLFKSSILADFVRHHAGRERGTALLLLGGRSLGSWFSLLYHKGQASSVLQGQQYFLALKSKALPMQPSRAPWQDGGSTWPHQLWVVVRDQMPWYCPVVSVTVPGRGAYWCPGRMKVPAQCLGFWHHRGW